MEYRDDPEKFLDTLYFHIEIGIRSRPGNPLTSFEIVEIEDIFKDIGIKVKINNNEFGGTEFSKIVFNYLISKYIAMKLSVIMYNEDNFSLKNNLEIQAQTIKNAYFYRILSNHYLNEICQN